MKNEIIIDAAAYTDKGNIRDNNEDNFYLSGSYKEDVDTSHMEIEKEVSIGGNQDHFICAVCDGVGGIAAGEEASLAAVKKLNEYDDEAFAERIEEFYFDANGEICEMMNSRRDGRMGTTAVVLSIQGDQAVIGNIGDSRAYLFKPEPKAETKKLQRLTKDQTRAQQLIDAGIFTEEEMAGSRQSHILSQHLGVMEDEFVIEPEIIKGLKVETGDIFLLCSDGLTDMIKEDEILEIMDQNKDEKAMAICRELAEAALDHGGLDNVTVEVLRVRNK